MRIIIVGCGKIGQSILHSLINEGLYSKAYNMPDDAQVKLKTALQKILNEGSGGLICIIL